jgi:hypothetical protein
MQRWEWVRNNEPDCRPQFWNSLTVSCGKGCYNQHPRDKSPKYFMATASHYETAAAPRTSLALPLQFTLPRPLPGPLHALHWLSEVLIRAVYMLALKMPLHPLALHYRPGLWTPRALGVPRSTVVELPCQCFTSGAGDCALPVWHGVGEFAHVNAAVGVRTLACRQTAQTTTHY